MIFFFTTIIVIYVITIVLLVYGFNKIKPYTTDNLLPKTRFSIIVPFRNEAENLPVLLNSFSKLNYPQDLFEVVLVNDGSTDGFEITDFNFKVSEINTIRKSNSPKKDAITTAIEKITNEWIVTTDADCLVHPNWLLTLDNYIQNKEAAMIAGAVTYSKNSSFLHHFQQLDLASLQGATIGSFGLGKGFMCNGANFAYTKSFFNQLNGFEGNNGIASGDDVFLLQKAIAHDPKKVHYLKSNTTLITTKPLNNWEELFNQRVRWASKTSAYQSDFGKTLALIVFITNSCWVLSFGFWGLGFLSFKHILLFITTKFIVDAVLIVTTNRFLKSNAHYLVLGSFLYPFFSSFVAIYSLFGNYNWKGRTFKK